MDNNSVKLNCKSDCTNKKTMMNRKPVFLLPALFALLAIHSVALTASAQTPPPAQGPPRANLPPIPLVTDNTHTLTKHFSIAAATPKPPNEKGFIQRWLVLEPVKKDIARNNILTDNYLKTTFAADNFSKDFTLDAEKCN